ncbi:MAG: hypothetical protein Ta2A_11490 [Treponemataceae bacterium]|nr:MAG: hypothetical protein Ta2A_11490 [Treponemataceae bacterium]
MYCNNQSSAVVLHWILFFAGRLLGSITNKDIEDFTVHLETKPDDPAIGRVENHVIRADALALKWATTKT